MTTKKKYTVISKVIHDMVNADLSRDNVYIWKDLKMIPTTDTEYIGFSDTEYIILHTTKRDLPDSFFRSIYEHTETKHDIISDVIECIIRVETDTTFIKQMFTALSIAVDEKEEKISESYIRIQLANQKFLYTL